MYSKDRARCVVCSQSKVSVGCINTARAGREGVHRKEPGVNMSTQLNLGEECVHRIELGV